MNNSLACFRFPFVRLASPTTNKCFCRLMARLSRPTTMSAATRTAGSFKRTPTTQTGSAQTECELSSPMICLTKPTGSTAICVSTTSRLTAQPTRPKTRVCSRPALGYLATELSMDSVAVSFSIQTGIFSMAVLGEARRFRSRLAVQPGKSQCHCRSTESPCSLGTTSARAITLTVSSPAKVFHQTAFVSRLPMICLTTPMGSTVT